MTDTDQILGAALLGHNAGEVICTRQVAMLGGLPYQRVRDAVLTHPTMGEGLNLLFDALAYRSEYRAHQPYLRQGRNGRLDSPERCGRLEELPLWARGYAKLGAASRLGAAAPP